jgi:DNA-binding NtrC family response regulator
MLCTNCNSNNRENSQYCLECGSMLFLKCPKCCVLLPLKAKFCDSCGYSCEKINTIESSADIIERLHFQDNLKISLKDAKAQFEKLFCEIKLNEFDWNISKTAEAIGLERSHLHKKIVFYKLKPPQ